MTRFVAVLLVVVALTSCSEKKETRSDGGLGGTCGLPKIGPNAKADAVPPEFVLEGVEVARAQRTKKRLIASLNVPHPVQEAFDLYSQASTAGGWEIIRRDNEGFEAEIYLRRGPDLGALQVRMSTCDDAVAVFVNVIRGAAKQ